jgi:hypothetical protein
VLFDLLLPVEAGALLTVPVDTLRLLLPCVAAGVDSLLRSVAAGLASLLFCAGVDVLRLSPFCTAAGFPVDLLPVAAELLLSLPVADARCLLTIAVWLQNSSCRCR